MTGKHILTKNNLPLTLHMFALIITYIAHMEEVSNINSINITIRMEEDTKRQFDIFCDNVGMNVTTAINMFIKATLRTRSLPFAVTDADSKLQRLPPKKYIYPAVFAYLKVEDVNGSVCKIAGLDFPDFNDRSYINNGHLSLADLIAGDNDISSMEYAKKMLSDYLQKYRKNGQELPAPTSLSEVALESNEQAILVEVYMQV